MPAEKSEDGRAEKGSQLQMQLYINEHQEELTRGVLDALPSLAEQQQSIDWVSPLQADSYREYRDGRFLQAVGLADLTPSLKEFWPARGPVWDGLARVTTKDGRSGVLLAEGKSYPQELRGGGSAAALPLPHRDDEPPAEPSQASKENRIRIETALASTARWAEATAANWITSPLYQTANRLAHIYWLREETGTPAWLVHVLFVNDPFCDESDRTSRTAWENALHEADRALGLEAPVPNVGHVYLDVKTA